MTRIFFSKEIDKEIVLWHAFLIYYTHLYKNWTEEQLGFDPKTLKEWLYNQFHCNNGNMFLVDGENSDSLGFLSFKLSESFVDICQVVGNKNQRDGFFKLLVELYPNARFYGVIRKQNKELLDY